MYLIMVHLLFKVFPHFLLLEVDKDINKSALNNIAIITAINKSLNKSA